MNPRIRIAVLSAILVAMAAGTLLAAEERPAGGDRPVLQHKDGSKPLPEDTAKIKDKEWLTISYPEFPGGFMPRLAVVFSDPSDRQNDMPPVNDEFLRTLMALSGGGQDKTDTSPIEHVEDIVRQALGRTNRFTMLERTSAKGDVLDEQQMGQSGMVDRKTAPVVGQLKGADFIVKATIIEMNPEKESKEIRAAAAGLGGGTFGVGSVGIKGRVAFCRLNVRLVNTTTGVVMHDMTVDGTSSASEVGVGSGILGKVGGGLGAAIGGIDQKKAASIADAVQACANKVAYFLTLKVEELPWRGVVAKVSPLIINAGRNIGLRDGLELQLVSKGEAIQDPDDPTVILEYVESPNGTIRITRTGEKTAACEILNGGDGIKVGDYVILEPGKR